MSNVVTPPSTTNFRDLGDAISPSWLLGPVGQRFRYSMAVLYDALADGMGYAIRAGLPSYAPSDAYPWLGLDRQIFQGYGESSTAYVARLIQWLDLWRHAGSNLSLLLAELSWVAPDTPEVLTVQSTGGSLPMSTWDTYAAGASPFPPGQSNPTPPYHLVVSTANWDWDGASAPYYYPWVHWRTWIVMFSLSGTPWAAPSATWGSFNWGDGSTCLGWAGTAAQAAGLTRIAATWKNAGVWVPWIVVSYDSTMFDASQSFGSSKLPDGTWGFYGKITTDATYGTKYVSARPAATTCTCITGTNDGGGVLGVG